MKDSLRIARASRGDGLVLSVAGEVDLNTVATLREALSAGCHEVAAGGRLVLDTGEVTFLSLSGIGLLLQAQQVCGDRGAEFILVAGHRPVLRVLQITGLDRVIHTAPTVASALSQPGARDTPWPPEPTAPAA
jgi:anti-anti-sigma factor